MTKQPTHSRGKTVGLSIAAIAAVAATAAGAYYFYGSTKGKAQRKKLSTWMIKAKAEVLNEITKMKDLNKEAYDDIVAKVAKKYQAIKGVDKDELAGLVKRLQNHWKDIKRDIDATVVSSAKASK